MNTRRDFLKTVGLATAAIPFISNSAISSVQSNRPNFIVILADDLGYECLSCNGGAPYKTPLLDKLAEEGIRFTNFMAQPLCTPTRVKLMTGRYNFRNYVKFGKLIKGEKTFGNMLKDAGYATCITGKWQLGYGFDLPAYFGFDEYCLWQLNRRPGRYTNPGLEINGKEVDYSNGEYGPDITSNYMLDFISRNKDRPFLCYYPMTLTHDPFVPTPDSADPQCNDNMRNFVDMVQYADKLIGKAVDHLEKLGIRNNTVIMFAGDNGTGTGIVSQLNGKNYPGGKGRISDNGCRVPFIVNWPAGGVRGKVYDDPMDSSDILPTLAALSGAKMPEGVTIDGSSFAPRLRGDNSYKPRGWAYVCYYGKVRATFEEFVRDTRYKLMGSGAMYDFIADPLNKKPIDTANASAEAKAARAKLQPILDRMAVERENENQRLVKIGAWNPNKKGPADTEEEGEAGKKGKKATRKEKKKQ